MASCNTTTIRRKRLGLCIACETPAKGVYCEKHRRERNVYQRERIRRVLRCKRRYLNAESYSYQGVQ